MEEELMRLREEVLRLQGEMAQVHLQVFGQYRPESKPSLPPTLGGLADEVQRFLAERPLLQAYVVPEEPRKPMLFVVTNQDEYNFDLGEALAEFSGRLIRLGLIGNCMQVPRCTGDELRTFFDPDRAFRIQAQEKP